MSIYGPTSTESQQAQQAEGEQGDHSMFAKKPDVLLKAGGLMHRNIDMTGHQVVNFRRSCLWSRCRNNAVC